MTVVKDSTRQLETLNVAEKKAVSSLRTNTDHTILVADKGSAKAVLNTEVQSEDWYTPSGPTRQKIGQGPHRDDPAQNDTCFCCSS